MSGGIDHLLDTNVVIGLLKGHAAAVAMAEIVAATALAAGATVDARRQAGAVFADASAEGRG